MFKLGKKQVLNVVKKVEFGVYLGEDENAPLEGRVLLPKKQVPEGAEKGMQIEVFIYRDSEDRLIATVHEPLITYGEIAALRVVSVSKIGAFLDWGLEKDLFLPYKEQTSKVREGEDVLVTLYIDKSERLCASMKVYHHLLTNSPYVIGDEVKGRVYEIEDRIGVFVAVEDKFSGLIPKKDAQGTFTLGEVLNLRVTEVKEDGKLSLTARKKAYLQIDEDAENILQGIDEYAGVLPFDDKASPEHIKREFGLSKASFKRAVGHLMKENKIEIKDGKIYRR